MTEGEIQTDKQTYRQRRGREPFLNTVVYQSHRIEWRYMYYDIYAIYIYLHAHTHSHTQTHTHTQIYIYISYIYICFSLTVSFLRVRSVMWSSKENGSNNWLPSYGEIQMYDAVQMPLANTQFRLSAAYERSALISFISAAH